LDPNAPILFCAAAALDRHKMRALSAGASAYLCKPIRPEILRSKLLALLGLADMESLSAKVAEERAIQEELEVRVRLAVSRADAGRQLSASSIERTAKARALKAFIEARGTRGLFESWWPGVFRSAWANRP
jgi:DNA-binding response OmpR family regulator